MHKPSTPTMLAAAAAAALALITACSSSSTTPSSSASTGTPTASPSASATRSTTATAAAGTAHCTTPKLTLTSPTNGTRVPDGSKGVVFKGKLCAPAGLTTLWAFDSTNTGIYNIDSGSNPGYPSAIYAGSGSFSWRDYPMGDNGVTNQPNTVTFVVANLSCTTKLQNVQPDANGDSVITSFPSGCTVVGSRTVRVTNK